MSVTSSRVVSRGTYSWLAVTSPCATVENRLTTVPTSPVVTCASTGPKVFVPDRLTSVGSFIVTESSVVDPGSTLMPCSETAAVYVLASVPEVRRASMTNSQMPGLGRYTARAAALQPAGST